MQDDRFQKRQLNVSGSCSTHCGVVNLHVVLVRYVDP